MVQTHHLMVQEEVVQELVIRIILQPKEILGLNIEIQKEEKNMYQIHGWIMKHKIIMLLVNHKDGEKVQPKVIKEIQVHLHGENMVLILQVNLMMIIIQLLMIGLWLK